MYIHHELNSFLIWEENKKRYTRCGLGHQVRLNGPGSDESLPSRMLLRVMNHRLPEYQELFTPAADVHDVQCHYGPNDAELEKANKLFRKNCYKLIGRRYNLLMNEKSRELRDAGGSASFFAALFSSKARRRWALAKELRALTRDRKEAEMWAEIYYTALKVASRVLVTDEPCTDRDLSNEK